MCTCNLIFNHKSISMCNVTMQVVIYGTTNRGVNTSNGGNMSDQLTTAYDLSYTGKG